MPALAGIHELAESIPPARELETLIVFIVNHIMRETTGNAGNGSAALLVEPPFSVI